MRRRALALLCAAFGFAGAAFAQAEAFIPYGEFRSSGLLSWHPIRREMMVGQRLANIQQVHHLAEPGGKLAPLTDLGEAEAGAAYQPTTGEYVVFARGRIHRFDLATKSVTPIGPEGPRAVAHAWNRKGDRLLFTALGADRNNPGRTARTTLHVVDPLKPNTARVLAGFEGGGWSGFAFSEDDKQVVFTQALSSAESHLWVMDVASGRKRRFTKALKGEPVAYGAPQFLKDGKSVLVTSDRGSDYRRLTQITIADGREYPLTTRHKFDVDEFAISFDAQRIAFTTNENGSHVLRFLDLATKRELTRPPLFDGVIGALQWRRKSDEVAFTVASARTAGDVFSFDVKDNKLTRWTNGNNPEVNTSEFAEPRLVKWKSFDGMELSAFLYPPPAKFTGKRPVLVNVPEGPATQAKADFIGRNNYCVSELGIAMLYPSARGASGFGKTFRKVGEGRKAEDAAKDLAALLDWIRDQPDLDGERVLVGSSPPGASAQEFAAGLERARARLLK